MKNSRLKLSLPNTDRGLPDLNKQKTSRGSKFRILSHSSSNKSHPKINDALSPKISLQIKIPTSIPPESKSFLTSEFFDFKVSEEFKKLNSAFFDNSSNRSFYSEILTELTPNKTTGNRTDARALLEWLDFMLKKACEEKSDNPDGLFDVANEIYSACLTETIRQVSAHCKERGYVIYRVWKAYQTLFSKALDISSSKNSHLQEKHQIDKNQLQSLFLDKISELDKKIESLTKQNEDLTKNSESILQASQEKDHREKSMLNRISILQKRYKNVKKELLIAKEDTRILKLKYENLGAETEYNSVVKRLIVPKRFKKKTEDQLEQELLRDPLISENFSDDSDIFDRLSRYGNYYKDRSIETLFNQDDFQEKAVETSRYLYMDQAAQTEVEFLCGEAVGVKKRKGAIDIGAQYKQRQMKPMFFPDYKMYNKRTLTLEAQSLTLNQQTPELKKKHLRIRRLLSNIRDVISYQECKPRTKLRRHASQPHLIRTPSKPLKSLINCSIPSSRDHPRLYRRNR